MSLPCLCAGWVISVVSRFSFFIVFKNPETTKSFHFFIFQGKIDKLIFRSVKTIYFAQSSFQKILCAQSTTLLKVLLTVTQITIWQLFSSFLVMRTVNNGCFFIWKAFCRFPAFSGFCFLLQSIFEISETTENLQKLERIAQSYQGALTIEAY